MPNQSGSPFITPSSRPRVSLSEAIRKTSEARSIAGTDRTSNLGKFMKALTLVLIGYGFGGATGAFGSFGGGGSGAGASSAGAGGGAGTAGSSGTAIQNMNTMNALSRGFGSPATGGELGGTSAGAGGGSFFDKFKSIPRQGMSGGRTSGAAPDNKLVEMMLEIQRKAAERRIQEEEERRRQFRPQF